VSLRLRPFLLASAIFLAAGALPAQTDTQISTNQPILNFRLPTFTPDGHRQWLIRGSKVLFQSRTELEVNELSLTIFTGDERDRIETMLLSPLAHVSVESQTATGPESIRVIDDNYEASGIGWTFRHKEKKVSLSRHVSVTIRSELKDLLK
jgi:hypothetical protein